MNQITIELPDKLAAQLNAYLEANPQETLALLIDEALRIKLTPKDSSKLLELAGIVTEAPRGAADHAEDLEN
jgi:metal-responsive CopG/Arc/MetJ family transcriptional regulator